MPGIRTLALAVAAAALMSPTAHAWGSPKRPDCDKKQKKAERLLRKDDISNTARWVYEAATGQRRAEPEVYSAILEDQPSILSDRAAPAVREAVQCGLRRAGGEYLADRVTAAGVLGESISLSSGQRDQLLDLIYEAEFEHRYPLALGMLRAVRFADRNDAMLVVRGALVAAHEQGLTWDETRSSLVSSVKAQPAGVQGEVQRRFLKPITCELPEWNGQAVHFEARLDGLTKELRDTLLAVHIAGDRSAHGIAYENCRQQADPLYAFITFYKTAR